MHVSGNSVPTVTSDYTSTRPGDSRAWAKQETARLRAMPADTRHRGPTLAADAIKLLAKQGYAPVIALLESVPAEYRPPDADQILKQAQELKVALTVT